MSDPGNTVVLKVDLDARQMYNALNEALKQVEALKAQLQSVKGIGDENFAIKTKQLGNSLKELRTYLNGFGTSLTTVAQKYSIATQTINARTERLGTSIGIASNQLKRATDYVTAAVRAGATGPNDLALRFTKASAAQEAYAAGLNRVRGLLAQIDALGVGYAGTRGNEIKVQALTAELNKEAAATATLKLRVQELALAEKKRAADAKAASAAILTAAKERDALLAKQNAALRQIAADERKVELSARAAAAAQLAQARAGSAAFGASAGGPVSSSARLFASQAARFANYAVLGAGIGGAYALSKQIVDLDTALHNLQGITQTTDIGMGKLRTTILDLSLTSKFSASQIATAATTLGQAGLSASQIEEALKPVILFAQASGSTIEESVQIMTSAMGAFNVQASELTNVADVFTAALNSSKLNIGQLSTAFQYSATTAAGLGISYNELVNVLSLMADAGIKAGSTLGTGFRQVVAQLEAPTAKFVAVLDRLHLTFDDVDIKSHGIITVLENLKKAGFDVTAAYEAFGNRGGSAIISMLNQLDHVAERAHELNAPGAAARASAIQMESLSASAHKAANEVVALAANAFAPLMNVLKGSLGVLGSVAHRIQELGPIVKVLGTFMILYGAVAATRYLGSLLLLSRGALSVGATLINVTRTFGLAQMGIISYGRASLLAASLFNPWLIVLIAASAAIVYFASTLKSATQVWAEAAAKVETARGKYADAKTALEEVTKAITELHDRQNDLHNGSAALAVKSAELQGRFKSLGLDVDSLKVKYNELAAAMEGVRGKATNDFLAATADLQRTALAKLDAAQQLVGQGKMDDLTSRFLTVLESNSFLRINLTPPSGLAHRFTSDTGVTDPKIISLLQTIASGVFPSRQQTQTAAQAINVTDVSKMSKEHRAAFDRYVAAINRVKDLYTNIADANQEVIGVNKVHEEAVIKSTSVYQQQSKSVLDQMATLRAGFPKPPAGNDALNTITQASGYVDTIYVPQLQALRKKVQDWAAKNKTPHIYDDLLQQITQAINNPYDRAGLARVAAQAKKLEKQVDVFSVGRFESRIQTITQLASHAKTSGEVAKYKGQVEGLQQKLFEAAAIEKMADLGIDPKNFRVDGFKIITNSKVGPKLRKGLDDYVATLTEGYARQLEGMDFKGERLDASAAKKDAAEAKKIAAAKAAALKRDIINDEGDIVDDARNLIKTLDAEIKAHLRRITSLWKQIDTNTPVSIVQDIYNAVVAELAAIRDKTIKRINTEQQDILDRNYEIASRMPAGADIRSMPGYTKPATADEMAARITSATDIFHDGIVDAGDKLKTDLESFTRLPTSFTEAWRNITLAMRDPRNTANSNWDRVDQSALLFQDVMQSVISDFRTSFADMLLALEEGTKTIGDAFKDFGKSTMEAALKAINANITQKALDFAAENLLPAGMKDIFSNPQQANTMAVNDNTIATIDNTAALLKGGIGGGQTGNYGIPGAGGGSLGSTGFVSNPSSALDTSAQTGDYGIGGGSGGFMSSIGTFMTDLFSKIGSMISSIISSLSSALSGIMDGIVSVLSSIYTGGEVTGYASGGMIRGKMSTRDSVYRALPLGGFVIRKTSVDKIGPHILQRMNTMAHTKGKALAHVTPGEFTMNPAAVKRFGLKTMRRMNADGKIPGLSMGGMAHDVMGSDTGSIQGLAHPDDLGGRLLKPGDKKHTTNVWVVKPDAVPQLSRRDVVVTISEDMLTNGVTKKLVKSIAAGM